jgi:hypothetical protein
MTILGYFVYATLFKLAALAAGVMSIAFGYNLFIKGILASGTKGTTLKADAGDYRITLRNAAPGTFFALFGAVILAITVFKGQPEIVLRPIKNAVTESPNNSGDAIVMRDWKTSKMTSIFQQYFHEGNLKPEDAIKQLYDAYISTDK